MASFSFLFKQIVCNRLTFGNNSTFMHPVLKGKSYTMWPPLCVCVCVRERESKWSMALDKSEYTVSFLLYIKKCVLVLGDNTVREACRARCKCYYCPSLCVEIDWPGDSVFWVDKWCCWQIDICRGNKLFIPVYSHKNNNMLPVLFKNRINEEINGREWHSWRRDGI